uniref:NB-ARC domain-containing protein n=1 Tax=Aegilops tauschii subsp. strangulata TaxID=200361 RepID=A0A453MPE9_AEGTS
FQCGVATLNHTTNTLLYSGESFREHKQAMAEFALGLTKTAVEGTLSRVKSAIEEEARLKEKVQHDLVFITAEFQMMQSFLNVANKERAENQVVRTWVRQLRDLAFDVEDCVEFVVHLDNKSTWWWRIVPSCMAPPRHRHLDEAAAEIKLLKERVEDVSQRNTRYNLISDSGSHTKAISVAEQPAPATANPSASVFPLLREVWDVAGRISNIDNLQDVITHESNDLQVISLWGSTGGDLGATFIFREVYYNKQICQEFKSRVWIKLMHPFNRDEFLKSFMIQLCTSSHQATVGMEDFGTRMKVARVVTEDDLIKAEQLMKENRYLVFLEEVSTLAEWDAIKIYLPDCKNGSRIVMSTQDLGVALMCTGDPYQVSELRHFSHGQAICAFFKTVSSSRRRDMSELKRLIRRVGVISVHGRTRSKLELVKELYHCIKDIDEEQYFSFQFGNYRWVNVSNGLNRMNFPRRLHLDLDDVDDDYDDSADNDSDGSRGNEVDHDDSHGLQANEVAAVDQELIEGCCKTLHEKDCLVVIDGLQSTEDWDWIKDTFLTQPTKGCIVVITNEEHVAKHCVDDEEYRAINCEYLEPKGRRIEEAHDWTNKFQLFGHDGDGELPSEKVTAVWGIAGIGKSDFVRNTYYNRILGILGFSYVGNIFSYYSWVDVPHPFNLTEFSRRLLLDFHSDDIQAKEVASISIIEGQDPIQGCRNIMSQYSYLVVFDGLRSKDEWDLIKDTFLSELSGHSALSTIVVITNEANVARYCVDNKDECVVNVKGLEAGEALGLFKKVLGPDKILTPREIKLSKHILAKCGGLPKVIVAIGKYCRRRNKVEDIKENFMDMLENDAEFDCLRGLFSWMHSYFEDCNDSLKPCIFYLPVFPTNHNIRWRRLMRRWIAEGYSRDTSSGTAEENGERLFFELVDLSIIQQPSI